MCCARSPLAALPRPQPPNRTLLTFLQERLVESALLIFAQLAHYVIGVLVQYMGTLHDILQVGPFHLPACMSACLRLHRPTAGVTPVHSRARAGAARCAPPPCPSNYLRCRCATCCQSQPASSLPSALTTPLHSAGPPHPRPLWPTRAWTCAWLLCAPPAHSLGSWRIRWIGNAFRTWCRYCCRWGRGLGVATPWGGVGMLQVVGGGRMQRAARTCLPPALPAPLAHSRLLYHHGPVSRPSLHALMHPALFPGHPPADDRLCTQPWGGVGSAGVVEASRPQSSVAGWWKRGRRGGPREEGRPLVGDGVAAVSTERPTAACGCVDAFFGGGGGVPFPPR